MKTLLIIAISLYSVLCNGQDLQEQIDQNPEEIQIGGGIIPILVQLDSVVYFSNCEGVEGVDPKWIEDLHVFKTYKSQIICNDTVQYIAVVTPKKKYIPRIKEYISDKKICTAPNK